MTVEPMTAPPADGRRPLALFVAYTVPSPPGGLTRVWLRRIELFRSLGWRISVALVGARQRRVALGLRSQLGGTDFDLRVRAFPEGGFLIGAAALRASARDRASRPRARLVAAARGMWLDRLCSASRPDIAFADTPPCWEALAATTFPMKRIAVIHEGHRTELEPLRPDYAVLARSSHRFDAIVTPTSTQALDLERVLGAGNVISIPHPLLIDPPPPVPREDVVVMLCRLVPEKGIAPAIDAFDRARHAGLGPRCRMRIWGTGPLAEDLRQLIQRRGLAGVVELCGHASDPGRILAGAKVLLSASFHQRESFGLSVLESLACGTPVIAFPDRYGPGEIVRDGVDGYLVPGGDVEAMSERLVAVMNDSELWQRLSRAAGRRAADFSPENWRAAWQDLLSQLDV